jgi:hypothetical protein
MPRKPHYHAAMHLLDEVHGADAANEVAAYRETVERIAQLFEMSERYQSHLSASTPQTHAPTAPPGARAA